MDWLCTIGGKVAEYTVEPLGRLVWRPVGYLIHYNQNLQYLSTQVQNLSDARDRVTHQVAEAERRGEQIYDAVQKWLKAVDLIIKETKEFLKGKYQATGVLKDEKQANEVLKDEHQVKMKCLHEFCPNPILRYQISRKSTKLKGVVDALYANCEACLQATENYESFESRNSIVRKIIDELRSPSADMILVCGVGGVGKTTLVKEICRQVMEAKLFRDAVMIRDVKNQTLEAIQKEIAEKLGLTVSSDQTISGRANSICERLKEKNTLVILDDLWEEVDFKALGLPHIPTCKIVLTSIFRKSLSSAQIKQKEFLLGALEENETWLFLKKKAGYVTNDPVIKKVATQVAGRCGGLPVLVITVARALEDSPLAMWEDALRCFSRFDEKEDLTSKAYLGLEWSYTQLNEQLKPFFLLCGTTIQGNSVSLTNLLKYSMGLGFFKGLTVKEARDALYTRVDKLKSYCLLLDGDDDTCVRMHDLVHDVALRIATRDQHVLVKDGVDQLKEWPDQDSFERCRKIMTRSCHIPNFPEAPWKCRELEMFLLHGNSEENDHQLKIPDNFFDEMQKLKVLGFYNLPITLLPPSLELLKISLQTLCLDGCTLEDIALVGELSNLETLSFAESKIKELPKEIARLTRLRLLDLSDCYKLEVISPNVISSFTRLEDLRMRNSFKAWEAEGDINERRNASLLELKQLPKLTALEIYIRDVDILPPNLFANKFERFHIYIGNVWESVRKSDPWSSTTLNTLKLKLTLNNQSDQGLKRLMMSSEDLDLDVTDGVSNILFQWDNEGFQHLKRLELRNNVVDITYISNRKVVLPNLTTLIISRCDHLRFLFSCSMATSFVALKHLEISACEIMEEVVSSKRDYNEENMNTMFRELETLKLELLPSLDRICTGTRLEFPALKELRIHHCKKLKAFMCGPMSNNSSRICKEIEEGELEESPSVKSECRAQSCLFDDKVIFPCLEVLGIEFLEDLETIWHSNQIVNPNSFCRLKEVTVSGCKSLISIFPPGITGRLNALKSLTIDDCAAVKVVFGVGGSDVKETRVNTLSPSDQLKPLYCHNLEVLYVSGADSLKNIMPASLALGLLRLRDLDVESCKNLLEIVGEDGVELPTPPHFVFPNATRVELSFLPQLKSFYPGKHTSEWPLLEYLVVRPTSVSGIFQDKDEGGPVKSLFQIDKDSFPNLKQLHVYDTEMWYGSSPVPAQCFSKLKKISFFSCAPFSQQATSLFLQQLHNIKTIDVLSAPPEEVFFNEVNSSSEEIHAVGSLPSVTTLSLFSGQMLHLGKENSGSVGPIFPNLEVLKVEDNNGLKNLESSAISFRNLTTLTVSGCEGLEHLITYSVAKSLMHLTTMQVSECPRLAVLVTTDGDDAAKEITFRQLQHLDLSELPNLQSFCSGRCTVKVPSLMSLYVDDCDKVRISNDNGKLQITSNKLNMKMVMEGNEGDEIGFVTEDYVSLDSRNSIVRKIRDELRSPSADMILVYGVGGVGKTTLVEEVLRQVMEDKDNLFKDAVMVRGVKVPKLEAIQIEIAEKLGIEVSSNQTISGRANRICERLIEKNTLVILDDLWDEVDFKTIGLPHAPTCKVVLTSRFRKLLSSAKIKQKEFLLGALEENETWLLFQKKAGDVTNDPVIQEVATQVAGRCGGLPLSVIRVARALENSPLSVWEEALRCLASFDVIEYLTSKGYLGLERSYTELNEQLKPLFLLCGTTIQGNSVSLTNLLKYSMGLGFFEGLTVKEARDALYTRVDKLKSYFLLLDGDDDTCVRMPYYVHDVALRIATRDQHVLVKDGADQLIEWPDQDSFERCRKIITRSCNIPNFPEAPWKCRELEMFLLHSNGEENDHQLKIPHKFFDEMQKLKVLGFYNLPITLLIPSLELLKISLQTLCLDGCTLEDIALVGELSNLETLSFANSKIKELPKEIARLTRLRLLDLSDCCKLEVISPNVISSLTRLEDLRMRNSFKAWEAEGEINERRKASLLELKQLPKLTALEIYIPDVDVLPPNLFANKFERFHIYIGNVWESDFWRSTTLNTLRLKLTPNNQSDQGLKRLMMSSEDLAFDVREGVSNILFQWDNERLQHLKRLELRNNVVDFSYIINTKVVLTNLTTLIISKCDHLRFLFSCSMATSFLALKHLKISACEIMEEVVSSTRDYNEENMNAMFRKLETLKLDQLPSLDRICTGTRLEFLALKELKINECKKLKPFMCGPMSDNSSRICKEIEEGELEENPSVKSECRAQSCFFYDKKANTFAAKFSGLWKTHDTGNLCTQVKQYSVLFEKSLFPKLENLTFCPKDIWYGRPAHGKKALFPDTSIHGSLRHLKKLRLHGMEKFMRLWENTEPASGSAFPQMDTLEVKFLGLTNLEFSAISFRNLTTLEVTFCWRLQYLTTYSVAKSLKQLNTLKVDECKNLKEIFTSEGMEEDGTDQIVLNQLQHLELSDLISLERFCSSNCSVKVPMLGPVKMDWCPFKLKVSPDKLLEVDLDVHLTKEVSHTIESASGLETNHGSRLPGITGSEHEVEDEVTDLNKKQIVTDTGKIANEGEQLELKRFDDVQLEQDIRRLLRAKQGLEKELRAKQEEMRDRQQRQSASVDQLSDPSRSKLSRQ